MTAEQEEEEQPPAAQEDGAGSDEQKMNAEEKAGSASSKTSTGGDRNSKSDDNAESSSTGSSEGKGSASGGGYSADCSASDQSSDDTGGRKEGSIDVKLSVEHLSLSDKNRSHGGSGGTSRRSSSHRQQESSGKASASSDQQKKSGDSTKNVSRSTTSADKKSASKNRRSDSDEDDSEARAAARKGSKRKSRHSVDIDGIVEARNARDAENATMLQGKGPLPQWGGVRIAHPMDPRIDLSTVCHLAGAIPPGATEAVIAAAAMQSASAVAAAVAPAAASFSSPAAPGVPSIESYAQIMEVVRPFFHPHGIPATAPPIQPAPELASTAANASAKTTGSGSDAVGSGSSEGFTSFFTTTHSSANNSGSPNSSDMDKKPAAQPVAQPAEQQPGDGAAGDDASSMAVLARVKRKYRRQGEEETSNSSRERRVRIQEAGGGNDRQEENRPGGEENAANQESSMSSTSSGRQNAEAGGAQHISVPPRIVTDVSSSNRDSSAMSNTNSGSGSTGNTGSGSNQGSSGSGNDGKGSSEDLPKAGDNSGEGTNEGSDGSSGSKQGVAKAEKKTAHRHEPAVASETAKGASPEDNTMTRPEEGSITREKKLQDKKRKRIEMRREYEALQQSESSENTSTKGEHLLRPGKPVTLDKVLLFSKIPRILIQSAPPFLVVHTNAAFSRMTALDSHTVVGKPITALLSMPNPQPEHGNRASASTGSPHGQAAAAETGGDACMGQAVSASSHQNYRARRDVGLERLVVSSGFGSLHVLQVRAKPHSMLGKNVTVIQGMPPPRHELAGARHDRAHEASVASSLDHEARILHCRTSIAPVVSSPNASEGTTVNHASEASPHAKAKRRKSDDDCHAHRKYGRDVHQEHHRPNQRPLVTHYVIQLHPMAPTKKQGSLDSLSSNSTSVEARLLGLSKAELRGQRLVIQPPPTQAGAHETDMHAEDEATGGMGSESSETKEHVAAIG